MGDNSFCYGCLNKYTIDRAFVLPKTKLETGQ
jgi:hypothetical protein